ncbi:AAA family ATPase [Butyrivibrio sp. WCE2006]|uniref:AAA family ATPase n=1 Tax=Butyrivibrio sp. WCE2006 TaxID=1410611 RepID=UPI0005D276C4|nr:AAA family ATPase [Butyrivibrio sp. WCE2006]
MLESLQIEGFRKYNNFKLENLNNINYVLGDNNIGKTSVLEAIYTWSCGQNVAPMMAIPLGRARYPSANQYWIMDELLSMINQPHDMPLTMAFEGVYNGKKERFVHSIYPSDLMAEFDPSFKNHMDKIVLRTNDMVAEQPNPINMQMYNPPIIAQWDITHGGNKVRANVTAPVSMVSNTKSFVSAKYIDVLSHIAIKESVQMYAALKREGMLDEVVKRISKVFPEIANFDMIPYPDGSQAPVSVVKKDGTSLPLYAYGDGVQRWFYIIGALSIYKNSIICIDEIDTGFHPGAQADFCKNVSEYAIKNNVQLFITTHNQEFIDRYLEEIGKKKSLMDKVNIITMRNNDGKIAVRNLSAREACEVRNSFNMELR